MYRNTWLYKKLNEANIIGVSTLSYRRIALILGAILLATISLAVSDNILDEMTQEERKKLEIWNYATQAISSGNNEKILDNLTMIIENNNTIPFIVTSEEGRIIYYKNIDLPKRNPEKYLYKKLKEFRESYQPIIIDTYPIEYLYYSDSNILKRLQLYTYLQLLVFFAFLFISILAIVSIKRSEQNRVWEGLSRETAHQLGTPISSLIAWKEYLAAIGTEQMVVDEMGKDIDRLNIVADRFQKIGSMPILKPEDFVDVVSTNISYLRPRISQQVDIQFFPPEDAIIISINETLIAWVIENLIKNAVNAMKGKGVIKIDIIENNQNVIMDISDTGCGIAKNKYIEVFRPGYTTRTRGWGLGLSLSKRIIEDYHSGKIFVKTSTINVGTTFRIILPKQ